MYIVLYCDLFLCGVFTTDIASWPNRAISLLGNRQKFDGCFYARFYEGFFYWDRGTAVRKLNIHEKNN